MIIIIFAMMFLCFVAPASATTPTISTVTGTVTTGQTLTITGTHMMDEARSNWLTRFQTGTMYGFENDGPGCPAEDCSCTDHYSYCNNVGDGVYDATQPLSGSNSIRFISTGEDSAPGACSAGGIDTASLPLAHVDWGSNFYYRLYTKYSSVNDYWPTQYAKTPAFPMGQSPTQNIFNEPHGTITGGFPEAWSTMDGNADLRDVTNPSGSLVPDRWYLWEQHVRTSDGGTAGTRPINEVWIDGEYVFCSGADCADPPPQGGSIGTFVTTSIYAFEIGITNVCGLAATPITDWYALTEWIDNFAISTTGRVYPSSIVEISGDNGSTWTYQPPTTLGDTSIAITADLPTLTAGNYLLRVTNNLQETSTSYALGGAGSNGSASLTGQGGGGGQGTLTAVGLGLGIASLTGQGGGGAQGALGSLGLAASGIYKYVNIIMQ